MFEFLFMVGGICSNMWILKSLVVGCECSHVTVAGVLSGKICF